MCQPLLCQFLFTHMSKISIPNAIIYEALDRGIYFEDAVPQLRIPVLRITKLYITLNEK